MSKEPEGSGSGSVLLAFLLGAAAGAAVALLFAPVTGKEAREYLGEKAREGRDKAAEVSKRARETFGSAIERGREAYREAREGDVV